MVKIILFILLMTVFSSVVADDYMDPLYFYDIADKLGAK
jgi:hypothetical protein